MNQTRILVVDDEAGMLEVCEETLQLLGEVDVTLEGNGERALECMREQSFDLAILDIRMPGINGVDVLRTARERDAELPILMMTAYPSPSYRQGYPERPGALLQYSDG